MLTPVLQQRSIGIPTRLRLLCLDCAFLNFPRRVERIHYSVWDIVAVEEIWVPVAALKSGEDPRLRHCGSDESICGKLCCVFTLRTVSANIHTQDIQQIACPLHHILC